mmetsp:Transcript_32407/g.85022  ORF Transcript_32407/g.85022 Transcript_32407/m.85022 type:complete len:377 (+) Transcript_32407:381-1511(+)
MSRATEEGSRLRSAVNSCRIPYSTSACNARLAISTIAARPIHSPSARALDAPARSTPAAPRSRSQISAMLYGTGGAAAAKPARKSRVARASASLAALAPSASASASAAASSISSAPALEAVCPPRARISSSRRLWRTRADVAVCSVHDSTSATAPPCSAHAIDDSGRESEERGSTPKPVSPMKASAIQFARASDAIEPCFRSASLSHAIESSAFPVPTRDHGYGTGSFAPGFIPSSSLGNAWPKLPRVTTHEPELSVAVCSGVSTSPLRILYPLRTVRPLTRAVAAFASTGSRPRSRSATSAASRSAPAGSESTAPVAVVAYTRFSRSFDCTASSTGCERWAEMAARDFEVRSPPPRSPPPLAAAVTAGRAPPSAV